MKQRVYNTPIFKDVKNHFLKFKAMQREFESYGANSQFICDFFMHTVEIAMVGKNYAYPKNDFWQLNTEMPDWEKVAEKINAQVYKVLIVIQEAHEEEFNDFVNFLNEYKKEASCAK